MIKKVVTYTDYDGEEITEPLYFHLTIAEVIELELSKEKEGGLAEIFKRIGQAEDAASAYYLFKDILLAGYLVKTPDGKRPIKNQDLRDSFAISEAYSKLVMGFLEDPEGFANFVNSLVPKDLMQQAERLAAQQKIPMPEVTPDIEKVVPRFITRGELEAMDTDDYKETVAKIATGEVVVNSDIQE